jgi:hypothetical protein
VLKLSPVDSDGLMEKLVTIPVTVGVSVAMAVPTVAVIVGCG